MTNKTKKYLIRAVVRHLNGDFELFQKYTKKAMEIYEKEKNMVKLEELIPESTKIKLYEMVS